MGRVETRSAGIGGRGREAQSLEPAWLLVCLPIGARIGSLMGLGELLGLLLAVPVTSCLKTFLDAWAQQRALSPPGG